MVTARRPGAIGDVPQVGCVLPALGRATFYGCRRRRAGLVSASIALPTDLRALLIDLDGVLYVEDDPIAGAVEALAALRASGRTLRFVTNTTSRPRRLILARLERLGFDVAPDELVTPAALAVRHCADRGHRTVRLVMNDELREDFAGVEEGADRVDAVIVGDCGEAFDYTTLNHAFRSLMDGAELVALQKNRFWLTPGGLSLDVGPFVAALEYAASTEAFVVGKPAPAFFAAALAGTRVAPASAAMVGDDVESDVGGALGAGLAGILVRTGKFREDALRASGVEPTLVIDSIADLPGRLPARAR
jgi:HAD superfamily hydrolase (TIGR01458 family)